MNDIFIFAWGVVAFLAAVGPLAVAGLLDMREKQDVKMDGESNTQTDSQG